ncbi:AAA family ATPase [Streptomyces sp. CA-106131]|uniref:AAA family ATPase n=1 Tax=Streptomyces sp. CA-106131 TaxID=3240045 RepID=UPI003D8EF8E3
MTANAADRARILRTVDAFEQEQRQAEADQAAADQDETAPRTWGAVDLAAILDGRYEAPKPTVGRRDDGIGLFYPGRMNSISSESEAGKTWFALIACLQEINNDNDVLYLDFEDDAAGVVGRLLALGAHPDDVLARFHYVRPENKPGPVDLVDLAAVLDHRPTLAVVDGVTEAMSMYGLELKDNTDVARFGRELLRPIADKGAAVVTLDHVVKSAENRGRYSIGGVHKLNGLNGVAYTLDNIRPFGVGVTGRTRIYIAKDRPAQLRRNALPNKTGMHWFGDLVVNAEQPEFTDAHIYPPAQRDEDEQQENADAERVRKLKPQILAAIAAAKEPPSVRGVQDRVTGKAADVRKALAELIDAGRVVTTPGPRNATLHRIPDDPQK